MASYVERRGRKEKIRKYAHRALLSRVHQRKNRDQKLRLSNQKPPPTIATVRAELNYCSYCKLSAGIHSFQASD